LLETEADGPKIGERPHFFASAPASKKPGLQWGRVYRSRIVWQVGLVYMAFGFSYIIYMTFFKKYLIGEAGYTQESAGNMFMLAGWFSIACGLIWGGISDKVGRRAALIMVYVVQAASFGLFAIKGSHAAITLSAVLFGLTAWSIPAIMAALCVDLLGATSTWWGILVLAIGAISAVLGVLYALTEQDIKRLLAYSTVENVGIILIGVGVGMIGMATRNPVLAVLGLLGALYHTHHGMTNGVFMPYVLVFNRLAIEAKIVRLAGFLGIDGGFDGFLEAVLDLRKATGVPHDLRGLKVDGSRLDTIVAMSLEDPTAGGNPVPLTKGGSRKLFEAALSGDVAAAA
jgi:MFS family permease